MDTLGQRIKHLRINKGETVKQTADAVGLTQVTYKHIENDEIVPHEAVLKRIAAYHEVTPEYLLNEKIRLRLWAATTNFFYNNKGKAFRTLTALGLVVAIVFPTVDFVVSNFSQEQPPISFNGSIDSVITGDYNTIIQYKKSDSIVELVDISIVEDGEFPVLDIKLRNSGDTIAFLYKLEVNMIDYFQMNNIHVEHYYPEEPSYNYDIVLTDESIQTFNISQVIPGNDVDRFTVTLATTTGDPYVPAICAFSIRLYYNSEEYVESGYMVIPISNPSRIAAKYVSHTDFQLAYDNYINLRRLNEYDAIKSDWFIKIYNSYDENKDDFS